MEGEILFLLLLALVVLGPRRLPEIGRQIGKALAELRRAKYEFSLQIEEEIRSIERDEQARKQAAAPANETAAAAPENRILPPREAPAGTVKSGSAELQSAELQPAQLPASHNS